jgi:hypothetical protein
VAALAAWYPQAAMVDPLREAAEAVARSLAGLAPLHPVDRGNQ